MWFVAISKNTNFSATLLLLFFAEWQPSPHDKAIYDRFFDEADTEHVGVITGPAAVLLLDRSGLERPILKQVQTYNSSTRLCCMLSVWHCARINVNEELNSIVY